MPNPKNYLVLEVFGHTIPYEGICSYCNKKPLYGTGWQWTNCRHVTCDIPCQEEGNGCIMCKDPERKRLMQKETEHRLIGLILMLLLGGLLYFTVW